MLKLYVSAAVIVEDDLVLVGTMVLFQLYKGSKGVGVCGVASA